MVAYYFSNSEKKFMLSVTHVRCFGCQDYEFLNWENLHLGKTTHYKVFIYLSEVVL